MKKFLAIYMAPVGAFDEMLKNPDPAKMKAMSDSWTAWMKAHEKSFVDQGAPTGKNKRVAKGSVKDVRNEVTGYSVVQADLARGGSEDLPGQSDAAGARRLRRGPRMDGNAGM